ncbi:hypothetical protein ACHQM5_001794 [Ranunculus cassubicifolius]
MAEAIVSAVAEQLSSIVRLELEQEVKLIIGVEREVNALTSTLNFIKALLEDAEKRQVTNQAVKIWLEDLKEITFDVEDVLDEWFTRISISQSHKEGVPNKVRSYIFSLLSCFQPVVVRHEIAHRITEIAERLDKHARSVDQLKLIEARSHQDYYSPPRTSSITDVLEIQGREIDKQNLLGRLVGESSTQQEPHIPIVSIVGMGGLGKTTLAQMIYSEIKSNFELSMWVCVSHPFDLQEVTKDIIEQGGKNVKNAAGWETLHQRLCSTVKGKKFLLVLDDVWSEDGKDWAPLTRSLDGGAKGSRIIVTTRNEKVANMMEAVYTHRLQQLSDEDSWSLFWKIVSLRRSQVELQKFEQIGKEIAKKCKGVPLAVRTLARRMRLERTIQDWRNVLASEIWEVKQIQVEFLPALLLSYYALPPRLKQCYLYTVIFPKGKKIKMDKLLKLWMAQGFLDADGLKEPEMIGAEYFNDLAAGSFFQDFHEDDAGYITECKMHDHVHDLARFLSGKGFRHIDAGKDKMNEFVFESKNLRSLIIKPSTPVLSVLCQQLRYLRVLDMSSSGCDEVSNEVGNLLHLRYLDLSKNPSLRELPDKMCDLYNLQTLKLNWCASLCKLPEGIGKLSNLRYIEVENTDKLTYFPKNIGKLCMLRTLCKFPMTGAGKGCGIEDLEKIDFLQGRLVISGLRHVGSVNAAKSAGLLKKKSLSSLKLDFGYFLDVDEDVREEDIRRMEGILEALKPDQNLQGLAIRCFPGSVFPLWTSAESSLCNVVKLELQTCKKCTQLPALGSLGSLENLYIEGLGSVEHIGAEFYGVEEISFPALKTLAFVSMEELETLEIPFLNFKKVMPRLCELKIESCKKLLGLPALGRLESLESLYIGRLESVEDIGTEFYGVEAGVGLEEISFPMLKSLSFTYMEGWKNWEVPFSNFKRVMPRLTELKMESCEKLMGLPALGRLESLESLVILELSSVKSLGIEFLGGGEEPNGGSIQQQQLSETVFPSLTALMFRGMKEWEEWNFPLSSHHQNKDVQIMPHICELEIGYCPKLKALPFALGKLQSLKSLYIWRLNSLKHFGWGDLAAVSVNDEVFPKLTSLRLRSLPEWEETTVTSASKCIMPCLELLNISECEKLKMVPHYMFSSTLLSIHLYNCPQLIGMQPCLPLHLKYLTLHGDVGQVSRSLLSFSVTHHHSNNSDIYPNLMSVNITSSPHPWLPQGLNNFTSLKGLQLFFCMSLDLEPNELIHFPMLQKLEIRKCPVVKERCSREDWRTLSNIPYKIVMDWKELAK